MSFFNICWERKQLGGPCFMHVPANIPYVSISDSIQVLTVSVFVCAVFHTSPSLLSFWQNYVISVGLNRLHCLHHGWASHPPLPPYPRKFLDSHCALCSICTIFLLIQQYRSILSAKMLRKWNVGKPWMTRRSTWKVTAGRSQYSDPKQPGTQQIHNRYLKSDHGTQLLNPGEDHRVGLKALDRKPICTNAVCFGCTVKPVQLSLYKEQIINNRKGRY